MIKLPDGSELNIEVTELWSCDPASLPQYTAEEQIMRNIKLNRALAQLFGWKDEGANDEKFK